MGAGQKVIGGVALLCAAGLLGWWFGRGPQVPTGVPGAESPAADVLYWYDPMRPEVKFDKPGPSPFMNMPLVPKYRASADQGGVSISPRVMQNLGVRTAAAKEGTFTPRVSVTGAIEVDERRIAVVATRASGWIEALDVRAAGDRVRRGERLAGLYSPDLLAAQEEYLLAVRSSDQPVIPAARRRLELVGVSASQIDRILRAGAVERQVDVVAPVSGVITDLLVREGTAVTSGMPLMTLADLTSVWVIAEVPQSQGAWLEPGQTADVQMLNPGQAPIPARVDYVYPEVAPATRTIRVRFVVANDRLALRPGTSVRVLVQGASRTALLVPSEALIRSGERTAVILAEGEGLFRPVAVTVGSEQGDQTEIVRGLKAGDTVVVSGQFLIDSEANLRGALDRLLPGDSR